LTDDSHSLIPFDQLLDALEHGDISTEQGMIRWSSNYTFLLEVVDNGLVFNAVYKPRSGERPLWDFPDGTLCQRERAAFLTSEALGWRVVPPTVLREGARGVGSVQFFVEHDPEYHYFTFDASLIPQVATLSLFDVVINNADRKGGHCIVDADNHLWGIDHGIAFHAQHKLRTVIWNFAQQPILPNHLEDLTAFRARLDDPQDAYTCEILTLLNEAEVSALKRRVDRLLTDKVYPKPGPGPNYPWPPV
jgi:hypothetical protein